MNRLMLFLKFNHNTMSLRLLDQEKALHSHSTIKVPFTKQKMCKNKSYRIGDISLVFKSWTSQEYRKKDLPK